MDQQTAANPEEVKLLMKLTFYTQCKHISQWGNINNLLKEWPYLFDELGMAVHFQQLNGIGLKEALTGKL